MGIDRTDADRVLEMLRDGNARFAAGTPRTGLLSHGRPKGAREGQAPLAAVVGCSDSRVPVELVFDAGPGDLFVVRTAGHVPAAASLASLRFAVESLGVRLIVVLGHEDCGAVKAVLSGQVPEWFAPVSTHICTTSAAQHAIADRPAAERLTAAVDAHVRETCGELRVFFDSADLDANGPLIVGATYQLETGAVRWL